MKISFNLNRQIITRTDRNTVVAGSKNYLYAKFTDISGDWIKPITAIFGDYSIILDDNNECIIPWEAIQKPGEMTVSAFCGNLHTANIETVEIEQSGYKQGETPKPPSDDVYNTLTQMVQNAVDTANSVRQDADSGKFDGADGIDGQDGKQGASVSAAKLDANGNLVFTVSDDTSSKDLPPINIDNANALKQINSATETALSDIDTAKNEATNQINELISSAETAATKAEQQANSAQESATSAAQSAEAAQQAAEQAQNIIDDDVISADKTWSSNKIVDTLCPKFEVSGSIVTCNPVENSPLHVVADITAVQEGEGDPSPENVRPIKGWDSVTIDRNGEKFIVSLPETVYGGTLDLVSGTLTITWKKEQIPQTDPAFITAGTLCADFGWNFGDKKNGFNNVISVGFKNANVVAPVNTEIYYICGRNINRYITFGIPLEYQNDKVAAGNYIRQYSPYIVYELATPYTIQLTPQQILALSSTNTVYADTGNVTVSGYEDPRYTINSLTERILALESATIQSI